MIYVTGGARSGKSRFAEKLATESGLPVTFVATAVACAAEMAERIARHRQDRPPGWSVIEAWKELDAVFAGLPPGCAVVDCVTVMISNLILEDGTVAWDAAEVLPPGAFERIENRVMGQIDKLLSGIDGYRGLAVVVGNEVGLGLSPAYPLGRIFRDIAGRAGQRLAERAGEAWMLVSGLPLRLK
jgi:adenosylcobinamide kinase/adenosylcobinamide-phosphate guanylyltransferase